VTVDEVRIPVDGDPFTAFSSRDENHPHACMDGYVYIGRITEQDGEEVEVIEAIPCRRCREGV
jgi:hypothetical protein